MRRRWEAGGLRPPTLSLAHALALPLPLSSQCCNPHPLREFTGAHRACKAKLDAYNEQRRARSSAARAAAAGDAGGCDSGCATPQTPAEWEEGEAEEGRGSNVPAAVGKARAKGGVASTARRPSPSPPPSSGHGAHPSHIWALPRHAPHGAAVDWMGGGGGASAAAAAAAMTTHHYHLSIECDDAVAVAHAMLSGGQMGGGGGAAAGDESSGGGGGKGGGGGGGCAAASQRSAALTHSLVQLRVLHQGGGGAVLPAFWHSLHPSEGGDEEGGKEGMQWGLDTPPHHCALAATAAAA